MISAVLMEGSSFDEADSLESVDFPVLPRVGEIITLAIEQRFLVKAVNHHQVQLNAAMEIFILVEHIAPDHGEPMPVIF